MEVLGGKKWGYYGVKNVPFFGKFGVLCFLEIPALRRRSKYRHFLKFNWEQYHQTEFITTILQETTTAYHLQRNKTDTEFLIAPNSRSLPHII